jgi:hypothetical protein
MDLYQGQFDFVNLTTQVADFNPGFGPAVNNVGSNGFGTRVFWTVAIPSSDLKVNDKSGKGSLQVRDLPDFLYPNFFNSVASTWQTPQARATVSFDIKWNGPITRRLDVQNGTNGNNFVGNFAENQATMTWSARTSTGFRFKSNPGNFATSVPGNAYAVFAHERNGEFVPSASASTQAKQTGAGHVVRPALDPAHLDALLESSANRASRSRWSQATALSI